MFMSHGNLALSSIALKPQTATPMEKRNTLADWGFYDVSDLNEAEFNALAAQHSNEGSILIVEPSGGAEEICIRKFDGHAEMLAEPGDMIQHFAIAGVGSSDVGAAALARTRANQLGKPVGAIVAGYGMADILQEALGGWFFFGAANRAQAWFDENKPELTASEIASLRASGEDLAVKLDKVPSDTRTLLKLLTDDGREVKSLLGHSKGCLSIAFALNAIRDMGGAEAIQPYTDIEVITAGAVCEMPSEMTRVRQYLGAIDWFGGLNSIHSVEHIKVPNAWHHVNTELPFHMNLSEVLTGRYD